MPSRDASARHRSVVATGSGRWKRAVHEEHRLAVDPEVAVVGERLRQPLEVRDVVVGGVRLRQQDGVRLSVPRARPRLVRPAEQEREVGLAALQHLVERSLEQSPSGEPVVVVAERVEAVRGGELRLRRPHLGHAEVVVAEVGGFVRLLVAAEPRSGAAPR